MASIRRQALRATALVGFALAASTTIAHATDVYITLDPNWSDYHQYNYTDTDGNPQSVPSGPYLATLEGGSFGTASIQVMCYDINVDTYIGQQYDGYLINPTTQADFEATYLESQLLAAGGYSSDVQTVSGPISMAIWQLENPSSVDPAPFAEDPAAASLIAEAQTAFLSGAWTQADADAYPIWIPDVPSSSQRFGIIIGPTFGPNDIVPEPASAALLGIGSALVLLGSFKAARAK